ncbi:hypothetical protein PanWU01x14_309970, partial [Parasponia andersonii]
MADSSDAMARRRRTSSSLAASFLHLRRIRAKATKRKEKRRPWNPRIPETSIYPAPRISPEQRNPIIGFLLLYIDRFGDGGGGGGGAWKRGGGGGDGGESRGRKGISKGKHGIGASGIGRRFGGKKGSCLGGL